MNRRGVLQGAVCAVAAWMAPAMASPEVAKINVAVGGRTLVVYLPFMLAWYRGAFRRQGLDVEILEFSGGTKALEALVGGSADFVSGAYEHVILLRLRGIRLKAIALQDDSFGLVVAVPKSKAQLYKSTADLRGKIVGVTSPGSSSSNGLKMFLAKAGLKESDVSVVGVGTGAAAVAAMASGRLDAISNFDPVISMLERTDSIHPLIDTRIENDLKALYGGTIAASSIYTSEDFLRRNPRTAQAVANAMAETLAWLRKASTDEIIGSLPPEFYGNDRTFYAEIIEKNRVRFSASGVITRAAAEATLHALADIDPQQAAKLDLDDTYDMSFIKAAISGP